MSTTNDKKWSGEQQAIFRAFAAGPDSGNVLVRARAGTGKTTTILEGISHAPEARIALVAFNKKIAVELQAKLRNPRAEAATLHSVGFGYVRRYWEGCKVDDKGERAKLHCRRAAGNQAPDAMVKLAGKLLGLAKNCIPFATQASELEGLAYEHECVPDQDWEDDGYDVAWLCGVVVRALETSATVRDGLVDFDDMLFLPVRNRWVRPKYDLVVVDEAQDMNACQLAIARGCAKGRIFVVGDDRQAIYGFRGAGTDTLDVLKAELRCKELGLTTTYRCARAIVALAAVLVPDYKAAPDAPYGITRHLVASKLAAEVQVGDFVLSRKNAPLVATCLAILRAGKRAKVEGRDVGAGLKALVRKLAKGPAAESMVRFVERLATWEDREVGRALAAGEKGEARAERVRDQAGTLRALAQGLSGVPELAARIDDLFADGVAGGPVVVCSSIHRAKGLEADRVFALKDTLQSQRATGGKVSPRLEEENLEYVAITRAKRELVWVVGDPPDPEAE